MRDDATERQVQAANPRASTWLSANAGSGKTRVLTDRVARLLLDGVEPQRILCLTYTKAAASEMQNRLFRRLGEWAMLEDGALRAALQALGVETVDHATLAQARRLFARAIETPGGLRIQTIHSFCATLLRRFPLEAGVSPQFTELDDRAARLLREEIVEEMADRLCPPVIADLARAYSGEDFGGLAEEVARNRSGLIPALDAAGCRRLYGLPDGTTPEALLAQVFLGGEAQWMPTLIAALEAGSANDRKCAPKLRALSFEAPTLATLADLEGVLLTGASAKEPFTAKLGAFPTRATREGLGPILDRLEALMKRVEAARPVRCCLLAAERARLLHAFASRFLPLYEARKAERGWLDFDDLIQRAKRLLTDASVAQWVLFRLDGGIDHILVDEAQDTSPDQWKVIELLAQEFTAGRGAREVERTIFVVGDKKQSIYSFQGADVAAFDRMRAEFAERLSGVQRRLEQLDLLHSFRSAPAILRLVDLTFDERRRQDLGGEVRHIAFRPDMPGRAELWPLVPAAAEPEPENWFDPVDLVSDEHHAARLARQVARRIRGMIEEGVRIPLPQGGVRPVTAGDFLILVQRRSDIFGEVIRACKEARLPIAGADRLKLGAELAVRDLSALLSFLATPEDDLSLAAVLRSPLFGWSEDALYRLAHGREGYLWRRLYDREAEHPETVATLRDLRDQADYLRPFDLIERALTRHDGRRRLLARLGQEAEDGIDELLSQALAYERTDVPSLTGFLTWLQTDEVEVKRQMEAAGGRIRVMTVHGAKGLEAPVVILPDTADRTARERDELFALAEGATVWKVPAAESPPQIAAAREARRARDAAENLRLLYVAMTRAQCWLIVAAAGKLESGTAWHDLIRQGMEALGAERQPDGRLTYAEGAWPAPAPAPPAPVPPPAPLPGWARRPAPEPARPAPLLSPSGLGGAKALAEEAQAVEEALARGSALHLLLETLPGHPPADWESVASGLLAERADAADLLAEARAVLTAPHLAEVMAPGALLEVPLTAEIAGRRLYGAIDRLIVEPGRVLAIDYKSNLAVPDRPEEVPEGLLRQMGAYAEALAQIYPGRTIETAILWTRAARLMPLPANIVRQALLRATTT